MLRNKLVRSDGSIIDSSVIISCDFTEEVNSNTNLSVGDVTASEISVEMLSTYLVEQDEVLTYYIVEDGVETRIGVFNVEKPSVASRTTIKFLAYDNVVKAEKIFSDWLRKNQELFPMTLATLVTYACEYCGLTFSSAGFPQSGIEINAFYADDISCRQILAWAGAIAGRYVRANSNGEIEFAWYSDAKNIIVAPGTASGRNAISVTDDGAGNVSITSNEATVLDDGNGNVSIDIPEVKVLYNSGVVSLAPEMSVSYKQGSLSYEAYATDVVERVQIKQSEDDVGIIYPEAATGNCFVIRENMLIATCGIDVVTQVAARLYEQLCTISYVPATVTLPRTILVRAGDIITIRDPNGAEIITYVMQVSVSASGVSIASTGDKSYETNAAVSSEKYQNLTGKVLEIKKTVEGLKIKNEDLSGKVSGLEISTGEFKTYVGETFVEHTEFGDYKSSVSTEFKQTRDDFEMEFTTTKGKIEDVEKNIKEEHDTRISYIRFEDGNIILGRSDSEIMLIQKNDRISFVRNVKDLPEVAWFSDDILHITEGEFLTQLRIGKFGFTPGANGNLSFKKVVT